MVETNPQTIDYKGNVTQLSFKLKLFVATIGLLDRLAPAAAAKLMLDKFLTPRRKPGSDYRAQLPSGARRLEVFHNLTKLTGWAWGEEGPAVLLIHGWEGHTGRMIPLIEPLLQEGYRVFALDAPGHGLSPASRTHLLDVSFAIEDMIDQHGPFFGVIAHSFGAAATTIALAREPQLMPEKLVLLSPMRDLQQHFDIFSDIARLSEKCKAQVRELAERQVGLPFEMVSAINAVRTFSMSGLVIHDRQDTLIPYEVGETIASNWHGTQLISTDNLGHRSALGDETTVRQLLTFLAHTSGVAPLPFIQLFEEVEHTIKYTSVWHRKTS